MIIELFGPPAAGKTTLARALATALGKDGFEVQLILSSRPAERGSIEVENARALSLCRIALAAPLSRAAKLASAVPVLLAGGRSNQLIASLMELLPPRTLLRSVRCRRFLSLLSRSWEMASTSNRIVIFDQGFLTALCSMALLAGPVDPSPEPSRSPRRAPGNPEVAPPRAAGPSGPSRAIVRIRSKNQSSTNRDDQRGGPPASGERRPHDACELARPPPARKGGRSDCARREVLG